MPTNKAQQFKRNIVAHIYDEPQAVKLADLSLYDEIQVRVGGLKESHVEGMVATLEAGRELPPIIVYKLTSPPSPLSASREGESTPENDPYIGLMVVVDGFHRHEAHKIVGKDSILARVVEGTLGEALGAAERANLDNAAHLSMEDKYNIYQRKFLRNEVGEDGRAWRDISGRERARFMRVSPDTESRWLRRLSDDVQSQQAAARVVQGADGRTYDTTRIKEANERRKAEAAAQRLKTKITLAVRNGKLGEWEAENIRIEECSENPTDLWLLVHYPNGLQKVNGAYSRPADVVYEHNKAVEAAERSIVEDDSNQRSAVSGQQIAVSRQQIAVSGQPSAVSRQPGGAHPQLDQYTVALYNRVVGIVRDGRRLFDAIRELRSVESLYLMDQESIANLQAEVDDLMLDLEQVDIYYEMMADLRITLELAESKAKGGVL